MKISSLVIKPREFGPNIGIPTIHINVDEGSENIEDLVSTVVFSGGSVKNVYVGPKIVKGMSAFLTALNSVKFNLEVQIGGNCSTPSWLNGPDLVLVDYTKTKGFNYFSLRKSDFIIFRVNTSEELEEVKGIFEENKLTPATKWLIISEDLYKEGFELVSSYLRTRISVEEIKSNGFNATDN